MERHIEAERIDLVINLFGNFDENVKIIDASTAHRTNSDWTYGFPELSEKHREDVKNAKRLAVPGCYASGFVSIVYPLIQHSIIENSFPVFSYATSGYSGGGKKLIADYESENRKTDSTTTITILQTVE